MPWTLPEHLGIKEVFVKITLRMGTLTKTHQDQKNRNHGGKSAFSHGNFLTLAMLAEKPNS
jgi:hypothetical protein